MLPVVNFTNEFPKNLFFQAHDLPTHHLFSHTFLLPPSALIYNSKSSFQPAQPYSPDNSLILANLLSNQSNFSLLPIFSFVKSVYLASYLQRALDFSSNVPHKIPYASYLDLSVFTSVFTSKLAFVEQAWLHSHQTLFMKACLA